MQMDGNFQGFPLYNSLCGFVNEPWVEHQVDFYLLPCLLYNRKRFQLLYMEEALLTWHMSVLYSSTGQAEEICQISGSLLASRLPAFQPLRCSPENYTQTARLDMVSGGVFTQLELPRKCFFLENKIEAKRSLAMKKTWLCEEMFFFFSRHMKRLIFFCKGMDLMISKIITADQSHGLEPLLTVMILTPAGQTPESARPCARTCIKHKADGKVPLWDRN